MYFISKVESVGLIVQSVVLTWQEYGLIFSEVLLLQGLFGFFILVFEFPSGVVADITTRKSTNILGSIFVSLGAFIYSLVTLYSGFLVAEMAFALGLALISGADSAFIWDTYLEHNKENSASNIIAKGRSIQILSAAIAIALGGYLSTISLRIPFYISLAITLLKSFLWSATFEPNRIKKTQQQVLREAISMLHVPAFLEATIGLLLVGIPLRVAFWGYIPMMQLVSVPEVYFGLVIGSFGLLAGITSWMLSLMNYPRYLTPLAISLGVIGVWLFTTHITITTLFFAIFFHQISRGVLSVFNNVQVNENVESSFRASAISLNSSINSLIFLLFTGITDILIWDLQESMLGAFQIPSILFLLYILLRIIQYRRASR